MKTDIFNLQIIPISEILVHEVYDQSRALPLVKRLKKEQVMVNPIIVAQIDGRKYLQLDGMNRFSAFKMLGMKSILCQIIDYNDQESVELSSWSHLFHDKDQDFIEEVKKIEGLTVKDGEAENVGHRYIKEEGLGRLCTFCSRKGKVYIVSTNGKLPEKVEKLNNLVSLYEDRIIRDVLPPRPAQGDLELLFMEHSSTDMMVVFPTFTRHQIVETVKNGKLFPAGITRHIIRRRCLNVNIPLSIFDNNKTVMDQNKKFENYLSLRNFRLYEEPTVYFE